MADICRQKTSSDYSCHSNQDSYISEILRILENEIGDQRAEILIGNIEGMVSTSLSCCYIYRATHPNTKLIYLPISNNMPPWYKKFFDAVPYSSFGDITAEYAFNYRNNYIVDHCDVCITYIYENNGTLFDLYLRAKNSGKTIYNLYELQRK